MLGCVSPGDVYALQGLSGCLPAFRERDSRGWLALHAAAVQPLQDVLRVVLQGEGSTGWVWSLNEERQWSDRCVLPTLTYS